MQVQQITHYLEQLAPPRLQEDYDNAGLLTGNPHQDCTGVLCCLDVTEAVIEEAIRKNCNLIVAHHPVIFRGLKKINGKNAVERTVIAAIKNDLAIYAIHTNLDNIITGVNGRIADQLGLMERSILLPREGTLRKLYTFVPVTHADPVREALFEAGGGHIGNYSSCSFNTEGTGTFQAGVGANPFVGQTGSLHREPEIRVEMVYPAWLESALLNALKKAHPYEEVAYDILSLENSFEKTGSGLIGTLPEPLMPARFLGFLKEKMQTALLRHTRLSDKPIARVAVCGGAGSFLIFSALAKKADAFITADLKYHEFFEADDRILLVDTGHYESEQFTIDLLYDHLQKKFPTFAVLKTAVNTNPLHYF